MQISLIIRVFNFFGCIHDMTGNYLQNIMFLDYVIMHIYGLLGKGTHSQTCGELSNTNKKPRPIYLETKLGTISTDFVL